MGGTHLREIQRLPVGGRWCYLMALEGSYRWVVFLFLWRRVFRRLFLATRNWTPIPFSSGCRKARARERPVRVEGAGPWCLDLSLYPHSFGWRHFRRLASGRRPDGTEVYGRDVLLEFLARPTLTRFVFSLVICYNTLPFLSECFARIDRQARHFGEGAPQLFVSAVRRGSSVTGKWLCVVLVQWISLSPR